MLPDNHEHPDANWCPDCGLPRGVCECGEMCPICGREMQRIETESAVQPGVVRKMHRCLTCRLTWVDNVGSIQG